MNVEDLSMALREVARHLEGGADKTKTPVERVRHKRTLRKILHILKEERPEEWTTIMQQKVAKQGESNESNH